jgi:hypothetical protein
MANSLGTLITGKLSMLASPERARRIGMAVSSFLSKPDTLTIALRPSEPIPAFEAMAASRNPSLRPFDRLGVEVIAK